jgi:hypothetical protein
LIIYLYHTVVADDKRYRQKTVLLSSDSLNARQVTLIILQRCFNHDSHQNWGQQEAIFQHESHQLQGEHFVNEGIESEGHHPVAAQQYLG